MGKSITDMISMGEGLQLDFKYCVNDSRKIARSMVAFANTAGGSLLLGVKDNGRIAGVKTSEEFYMIEQAATLYCRPSLTFRHATHLVESKTVLQIIVPFQGIVPYLAPDEHGRWKVYIRKGDQNLLANRILLEVWKQNKSGANVRLSVDRDVEMLLNYLNHNEYISLETFLQITGKGKRATEDILVGLILMNLLDMEFTESSCQFRRKKN